MNARIRKISYIASIGALMILFGVVLYTFLAGNYQRTTFLHSYEIQHLSDWTMQKGESDAVYVSEFPVKLSMIKDEPIVMTATLPEIIPDNYGVMMFTNYGKIEIYADDVLIESYARHQPLSVGRLVGNVRLIGIIPKEMAGKELRIVYSCFYSANNTVNEIVLGDAEALKLEVMYQNLWRVCICVLLLELVAICTGYAFARIRSKNVDGAAIYVHLGLFLFYITLWLICSSDIPQFVTNANETVSLISFLSLATVGIHFAGFCKYCLPKGAKTLYALQLMGFVVPGTEILGFVSGAFDPLEVLILNHVYLITVAGVSAFWTIRHFKQSSSARCISLAVGILTVFVGIGLISFYANPSGGSYALVMAIGLFIFGCILLYMLVHEEKLSVQERTREDIVQNMAYLDSLTGLSNRAALIEKLHTWDYSKRQITFEIGVFNIVGLKEINRSFFHSKGDEVIVAVAKCIRSAYEDIAEVYRIDGDEFLVVHVCDKNDSSEWLKDRLPKMEELIRFYSNQLGIDLQVASGIVTSLWHQEMTWFTELYMEADRLVQRDKEKKRTKKD